MITVRRATFEIRQRDKKRCRLLLTIGRRYDSVSYHITREEAAQLERELKRFRLPRRRKGR